MKRRITSPQPSDRFDDLYRFDPLLGKAAVIRHHIRRALDGGTESREGLQEMLREAEKLLGDVMARLVQNG